MFNHKECYASFAGLEFSGIPWTPALPTCISMLCEYHVHNQDPYLTMRFILLQ